MVEYCHHLDTDIISKDHFTHLDRSLAGWMSAPMPKFLLLFSKSGLTTLLASGRLTDKGAAATFFPAFFPFLATMTSLQQSAELRSTHGLRGDAT